MSSGDPSKRLKLVVDDQLDKAKSNIDSLYLRILRTSLEDSDSTSFKTIVGAIIVTKEHLNIASLKGLLCLPDDDTSVHFILNALRPVVSVSPADGWVRINHQSFTDFLTSSQRCPEKYFIRRGEYNRIIALACLKRMNSENGLEYNICGLETSSLLNDEVPDLAERIEGRILLDLSYACRFWASHIQESPQDNSDAVVAEIEVLLHNNALYWIEALSLLKCVPMASMALLSAARWLRVRGLDSHSLKLITHIFNSPSNLPSLPLHWMSAVLWSPFSTQSRTVHPTYTYPHCHSLQGHPGYQSKISALTRTPFSLRLG
jgi:hypothetical protein